MKRTIDACLAAAVGAGVSFAVAAGDGSGGTSEAVSSGIRLVSAGAADASSGVVFDGRWQTSAVSNPDPVNRAFGVVIIVR